MFSQKQDSDSFIKYLEFLMKIYLSMIVVIDNAAWHRSKKTKSFVEKNKERVEIVYLPPYSPEMNPTEECWRQTRMNLTTNRSFNNIKEMQEELVEFFDSQKFKHSLLSYLGL